MSVASLSDQEFLINGQIILSTPGGPCLRCCGFITEERLAREAEDYGAAGPRPQVVWANGVLASTAVGIAIQLLTPWHRGRQDFVYLEYDGNILSQRDWMTPLESRQCPHDRVEETGDPAFDIRQVVNSRTRRHVVKESQLTESRRGSHAGCQKSGSSLRFSLTATVSRI